MVVSVDQRETVEAVFAATKLCCVIPAEADLVVCAWARIAAANMASGASKSLEHKAVEAT